VSPDQVGDEVELGHLLDVLALFITMMATRAILARTYKEFAQDLPTLLAQSMRMTGGGFHVPSSASGLGQYIRSAR